MHKPVISIRADGNAKIGLGHIYRTISLAGYLKDHFEIQFYIYQPDDLVKKLITEHRFFLITVNQKEDASEFTALLPKGSIVLLDGYNFNIEYQQKIKNDGYRLVILDDLNSETQIADVVINHGYTGNLKDYKISDHTALYTGLDYLIVKPEIISASFTDKRFGNKKILVCMGGTDPDNHSGFIVKELLIKTEKQIKLVTSVLNPKIDELKLLADQHSDRLNLYTGLNASEMISLTQLCDIAILQPSNIALESACLGIYILLFQTAENQLYIKDTLIKKQCATKLNKENLVETINSISTENINAQLKKQQQNFDRQSPARILSVFKALLIDVAKVSEEDAEDIYKWNNDPVTRQNSYQQNQITHEEHMTWFRKKIKDNSCCFLILKYQNQKAGTVRIEIKENENIVGITVAPEFRGKKLAPLFLQKASDYFFKKHPGTNITAYIKIENTPSIKSFEKAGYIFKEEGNFFGSKSLKLIKTNEQL